MVVNPIRVGLVFGIFVGLAHAGWATLVAIGFAQKLVDFIFWAHFITPAWHIETFDLARAGILVAVTFGVALIGGIVGGSLWNVFHRG